MLGQKGLGRGWREGVTTRRLGCLTRTQRVPLVLPLAIYTRYLLSCHMLIYGSIYDLLPHLVISMLTVYPVMCPCVSITQTFPCQMSIVYTFLEICYDSPWTGLLTSGDGGCHRWTAVGVRVIPLGRCNYNRTTWEWSCQVHDMDTWQMDAQHMISDRHGKYW